MFHSRRFVRAFATLCGMSLTCTVMAGPEWPELGDAGRLPGGAQIVLGSGSLESIRGALSLPLTGPGDFEDMYLIKISDPTTFCAKTIIQSVSCGQCVPFPLTQPTNFNTQLWIFKADGRGLLGNDDDPADPPRSRLGNAADDGSGAVITTAGLYYIAISGGPGNDPQSSTGPIFNQVLLTEVSGPDGAGGANPIIGWSGGGPVGQYQILLCGASFVEQGDIPTVSEWGLIILAIALAAGGAIIIRRKRILMAA